MPGENAAFPADTFFVQYTITGANGKDAFAIFIGEESCYNVPVYQIKAKGSECVWIRSAWEEPT